MKTNPETTELIDALKTLSRENDVPIWRDVAKRLERPAKSWSEVNLYHIEDQTQDGESALVAGKVLGVGDLARGITIAAVSFSASARDKIEKADGKAVTILKLADDNPKGNNIRILG